MKHFMPYLIASLFICLAPMHVLACSAFYWGGEKMLFGRNLDWYNGSGYVMKNNRGQQKFAYSISLNKAAHWVAKYGSITFNQIGKEFPYGGINEKGLVVEQLWLHATTYQDNKNETISELEWIQYQLDNYEHIDQIIQHLNELTIKPVKATVHYFIADRLGNSAAIDFIGGKAIVSKKNGISQTLTNTAYQASLAYYKQHHKVDTASRLSEDRFCQVSENLKTMQADNYQRAFNILALSAENQKNYKTYWTIVYDLSTLTIYFKTFANQHIKTLSINDVDFAPNSAILGCNINTPHLEMKPYTFELNKALLADASEAMNIKLNIDLAAKHQYNPSEPHIDSIYIGTYATLKITFLLKHKGGYLYYTVAAGEKNFNTRRGSVANMLLVDSAMMYSEAYAIEKGEYGLACFHDKNGNKKLDAGLFGIPKETYAFSKNKKGIFGLPPKYGKVKFSIVGDTSLLITF